MQTPPPVCRGVHSIEACNCTQPASGKNRGNEKHAIFMKVGGRKVKEGRKIKLLKAYIYFIVIVFLSFSPKCSCLLAQLRLIHD